MSRQSTGKKLRFEVLKRDGFACQYCGRHPPQVLLHVDHIVAVAEGGETTADNLVTACQDCNLGKGARPLHATPESLQSRQQQIAEAEEQLRGYQELMASKAVREEEESWNVHDVLYPSANTAARADLMSIKAFIRRLGVHEVIALAEVAVLRKPYGGSSLWKYFCGCCWNRIREMENGR